MLRSLTANLAADHKEREHEDLSGLFFGPLLMTNKLGLAVAVGIGLAFLNAAGFQGDLGADNTPDALRALTLVFIATPCVMYALSAIAAIALDKRISSDKISPLVSDTVK
ncbi:MAG: MFS transporter [Pseudomonadota bacterium]